MISRVIQDSPGNISRTDLYTYDSRWNKISDYSKVHDKNNEYNNEYIYDNSNNLIASTLVEIERTTTSGVYISIQEKENIINDLIYLSLLDLSNEPQKLIIKYMGNYIL